MVKKEAITNKINQHNILNNIDIEELLHFLSIYKKNDLFFESAFKRKFPHLDKEATDLLFKILVESDFIKKIRSYTCPNCGHKYYSDTKINQFKEYEECCCEYCDEISNYNEKYLGFGYRVM